MPSAVDLCLVLASVWCSAPQMTNLSLRYEALSNKSCADSPLCSCSCGLTADDDSPGRSPCAPARARCSPLHTCAVRVYGARVYGAHVAFPPASCAGVHMRETKTGEYMLSEHEVYAAVYTQSSCPRHRQGGTRHDALTPSSLRARAHAWQGANAD